MTFGLFLIIAAIGLPIHVLFNYKITSNFSKAYLFKTITPTFLLVALAVLEYLYFDTLTLAIIFSCVMGFIFFKCFTYAAIMAFVMLTHRVEMENLPALKLFLKNLKVRSFYLSKGNSDIYFLHNDGVNIYFDKPQTEFNALSSGYVAHFQHNIVCNTMKHVSMDRFIILNVKDDYISLSSAELNMLDVPIEKITHKHFEIAKMLKI